MAQQSILSAAVVQTRKQMTVAVSLSEKMAPVTMPIPELDFGKSAENCVTDAVIKFGGGLALGSVMSLLFFKRRRWPIILGGGFGIGAAWANCSKDINKLTASSKPKATM